jgi:hypothetical protein
MDTYPNDGYDYVTDPDGRVDQGMLDAGAEEFLLHLETAALQPEPKPAHVGRFAASSYAVAVLNGARYIPILFM